MTGKEEQREKQEERFMSYLDVHPLANEILPLLLISMSDYMGDSDT